MQVGIPLSECKDYISVKYAELDTLNFELRKWAQTGLKTALTKLTKLANGDGRCAKDFESTDLKAAEALAKISMDALKLSASGQGVKSPQDAAKDLFDTANNPWKLNKVE